MHRSRTTDSWLLTVFFSISGFLVSCGKLSWFLQAFDCTLIPYYLLTYLLTKSPLVIMWDAPNSPPKLPTPSLPFDDHHPSNKSFDRPHSPSQTASGSNQQFCHNFPDRQTDRQTHTDQQMVQATGLFQQCLRSIDRERCSN